MKETLDDLKKCSDEELARLCRVALSVWEKDDEVVRPILSSAGLAVLMLAAHRSNADTLTFKAGGLTHKGEELGEWKLTLEKLS